MTDLEKSILAVVTSQINKIYTDIPAKVISYDATTQLCKVQPLIDIDGNELPPIPSVPVQQIGGSDWMVMIQIDAGTEGILKACMRDIGTWLYNNNSQSKRKFSLTDTVFEPGYRSKENAIPNPVNNGVQLRSRDGNHFAWLKNDGNFYVSGTVHCQSMISQDESYAKGEVLTRISHTHKYTDDGRPMETQPAEQK